MSITTQIAQTSTIGLQDRASAAVNDPNLAVVALFSALGLLASLYFMIHFAADFLAAWL